MVSLLMSLNSLSEEIEALLPDFVSVSKLDLAQTRSGSEIPEEIGLFTNLTVLFLAERGLKGPIPPEIGKLVNLTELYLDNNQLSGTIPEEISCLVELNELQLDHNLLSGDIPKCFGSLINLTHLYLNNNQLTGDVPLELCLLTELVYLNLRSNQLSGCIPAEFGCLSHLETLYLDNNRFTGSIPAELGKLKNLKELELSNNFLTGNIPKKLKKSRFLSVVNISNNRLNVDSLPSSWEAKNYFRLSGDDISLADSLQAALSKNERVMEWTESLGIPKNLFAIVEAIANENVTSERLEKAFSEGKIPLGFTESPIWPSVFQSLEKIPSLMEGSISKEQELSEKIRSTEEQIRVLQQNLNEYQQEYEALEEKNQPWKEYSDHSDEFIQTASSLKDIESKLASAMEEKLDDIESFESLDSESESPKLSLVLNALGMNPSIIQRASYLDGYDFVMKNVDFDLSLEDRKDLEYCRHMLMKQRVPFSKHQCPVCACDSVDKIVSLLSQQNIEADTTSILPCTVLTGPRLLMLSRYDVMTLFHFTNEQAAHFQRNVIHPLSIIHRDAIQKDSREQNQ